ncbi:MAG TPA: hypothetical protein VKA10_06295 [Prolixibacteraceae bacterium]|nr:hypothetical protein [Prolixibacteraceae bacterium]
MRVRTHAILFLAILFIVGACGSPKFIYDEPSKERQAELNKSRAGNIFANVGVTLASVVFAATFETELPYYPEDREFKKLKLLNTSKDTLYVNMLTDVFWDEYDYCDFMDIRIPPKNETKILVPTDAKYHLYFSNTMQPDDDELLEIYTNDFKKIALYPGLTNPMEANNPDE